MRWSPRSIRHPGALAHGHYSRKERAYTVNSASFDFQMVNVETHGKTIKPLAWT
jgi:hypothetical protein